MNLQGCPPDSKSGASASFATSAKPFQFTTFAEKRQPFPRKKAAKGRLSLNFSYCSSGAPLCICNRARTDGCNNPRRSRRNRRRDGRSRSNRAGKSSSYSANRHSPGRSSRFRFPNRRNNRRARGHSHSIDRSRNFHCNRTRCSRTAANKANT